MAVGAVTSHSEAKIDEQEAQHRPLIAAVVCALCYGMATALQ
jgi:hypothetical protein